MRKKDILLAVLIAAIWGFNFVVIEIGLKDFPPILFSALRFAFVGIPAVFFIPRNSLKWRWIVYTGITLGIGMFSLLYIGMYLGISAGLASVVLQVQMVFTLILAYFFLNELPSTLQFSGIIIVLFGLTLLGLGEFQGVALGGLFVITAGFAWATSNMILKVSGVQEIFRLIVWMSLLPPIPLILISLVFESGQLEALRSITWQGLIAILYTAFIATLLAFGVWGRLLSRYPAVYVVPFSLLVPPFGLLFAYAIMGESLTSHGILASLLILCGLSLVLLRQSSWSKLKLFRK